MRTHALYYHGPFELNFRDQLGSGGSYLKRDGKTRSPWRGPSSITGIRFGQMEKKSRKHVITRLTSFDSDVCLNTPVPGKDSGPNGTRLTREGALAFLEAALKVNPELRDVLLEFRSYI